MGALYTYVNARCPDDDGQRALRNKAKPSERARSPTTNPTGFTRTRIFVRIPVAALVGLRVALTLGSAVASSGRDRRTSGPATGGGDEEESVACPGAPGPAYSPARGGSWTRIQGRSLNVANGRRVKRRAPISQSSCSPLWARNPFLSITILSLLFIE